MASYMKRSHSHRQLMEREPTWGRTIVLFLAVIAPSFVFGAAPSAFYVSPSGSDSNPVTDAALPFQTLARAQTAVRSVNSNATDDITVYLAGGKYPLQTPVALTPADSGQNGHRIIWRAMENQSPIIDGAILLTNWTLHDAAKNIWQASVPAGTQFRQLYVNGVKGRIARSADAMGLVAQGGFGNTYAYSGAIPPSAPCRIRLRWRRWKWRPGHTPGLLIFCRSGRFPPMAPLR